MGERDVPSAGEGFGQIGVRIVSAAVFGIVVLGVILFGGVWGLGLMLALAAALGGWELSRLAQAEDRSSAVLAALAGAAIVLSATVGTGTIGPQAGLFAIGGALALVLLATLAWLTIARGSSREGLTGIALAALWVGFGLAHLVLLRAAAVTDVVEATALPIGKPLVLLTVLGVWAGDVAAYVVGVAIGRHKLAPRLSPGKSWEGFIGGLAATVAVWALLGGVLELPLVPAALVIVGVVSAVVGLLGDLAESRLKRLAGVKDSGRIMPGHGGMLDRVDSLILVSLAVFWLAVLGGLA